MFFWGRGGVRFISLVPFMNVRSQYLKIARLLINLVMDLQIWLKTHTNVSNFETASPKTI